MAEIARGFRILSVDYSSSRDNKTEWRRRRRGDDDFLHESGRWRDSRVPEQPREAALMQSGRERAKTATIPAALRQWERSSVSGSDIPRAPWAVKWNSASGTATKLGEAGGRLGDRSYVDCAYLPLINLRTQNSPDLLPNLQSLTITSWRGRERERLRQSKSMVTNERAKLKPVL